MHKIILTSDEYAIVSSILEHIIQITEEEREDVFIPNYENLMLHFSKYDFETLKELVKKL